MPLLLPYILERFKSVVSELIRNNNNVTYFIALLTSSYTRKFQVHKFRMTEVIQATNPTGRSPCALS